MVLDPDPEAVGYGTVSRPGLHSVFFTLLCLTGFCIIDPWLDAAVGPRCAVRLYITFNYRVAIVFFVK